MEMRADASWNWLWVPDFLDGSCAAITSKCLKTRASLGRRVVGRTRVSLLVFTNDRWDHLSPQDVGISQVVATTVIKCRSWSRLINCSLSGLELAESCTFNVVRIRSLRAQPAIVKREITSADLQIEYLHSLVNQRNY